MECEQKPCAASLLRLTNDFIGAVISHGHAEEEWASRCPAWLEALREASSEDLIDVAGRLLPRADRLQYLQPLMTTMTAEIERKNAADIVSTMRQLDETTNCLSEASNRLAKISLGLGLIGVVLTFAQVALAIAVFHR